MKNYYIYNIFTNLPFINEVKYGTIKNFNYDNVTSPTMQVFLIRYNGEFEYNFFIMNYYNHQIFFQMNSVFNPIIMPDNTLYFAIGYVIYSLTSNGINQISKTFDYTIKKFIWANDIQQLIVIMVDSSGIYDQYGDNLISESDTTYLKNMGTIIDIAYDEIHSDLYIIILTDVFVIDMKKNRIWYRYSAYRYRQEFLIISTFLDAYTDTIIIMNSDFQNCSSNAFNLSHAKMDVAIIIGDIENTDIFYIFCEMDVFEFRQYSIFAEYPNCVKCTTGSNMWFYSYMYGCSNTCEGVSRKNYPYCEPSCSSQNCLSQCTGADAECELCDNSAYAYNALQIGTYKNCQPQLNCNNLSQYSINTSSCGSCMNSSCSKCLSSGYNQCFYCYPPYFFDINSTSCINNCNGLALTINSFQLCLPVNTCPYGNYTVLGDTFQCTHVCNDICETCIYAADNCTSCKGNAILFNNTCYVQCPQGYFYGINYNASYYQKTCLPCTSTCASCALSCQIFNCLIPLCKMCDFNNSCLICESNSFNITGQCLSSCPPGYHSNYQTYQCEVCITNCTTCNNTLTCTQCVNDVSIYLSLNGLCNQCNISCLGCTNNANNCSLCSNNSHYLDSKTGFCMENCNPGSFAYNGSKICYPCNMNCSTCVLSETNCHICNDNLYLIFNNATNEYNCRQCQTSNGYFIPSYNDFMCVECGSNCKMCIDNLTCLECYPNYIIIQSLSSSLMNTCLRCNTSCLECQTNQYNKCFSCADSLLYADISSGFCLTKCPYGSYISNSNPNQCSQCNSSCGNCFQNADNCTECNPSQVLFINESNYNKGSCLNTCLNHQFIYIDDTNMKSCRNCSDICERCSLNETNCTNISPSNFTSLD